MQIMKKLFLILTLSWRHEYPYDTHHGVVINRATFDAYTNSSFRGVKQTHLYNTIIKFDTIDHHHWVNITRDIRDLIMTSSSKVFFILHFLKEKKRFVLKRKLASNQSLYYKFYSFGV